MKAVVGVTIACGLFLLAGCAEKAAAPPANAPSKPGAPIKTEPPADETLPRTAYVNIAAADMGGAVEEQTDNYGPGFMGRRLVDGLMTPAWIVDTRMKGKQFWLTYPQEAVVSFFEREPAEIDAVTIVLPDPATLEASDSGSRPTLLTTALASKVSRGDFLAGRLQGIERSLKTIGDVLTLGWITRIDQPAKQPLSVLNGEALSTYGCRHEHWRQQDQYSCPPVFEVHGVHSHTKLIIDCGLGAMPRIAPPLICPNEPFKQLCRCSFHAGWHFERTLLATHGRPVFVGSGWK